MTRFYVLSGDIKLVGGTVLIDCDELAFDDL